MRITGKIINLGIISASFIAVAYSFFAEYYLKYEPCPLCIVQRLAAVGVLLLAIIVWLLYEHKLLSKILLLINLLVALFGVWVAHQHYWLTTLPADQVPASCGMPIAYMFKTMPLNSFLHSVLSGDAECSVISLKILGVSAPIASCGLFVMFSFLIITIFITKFIENNERFVKYE